MKAMTSLKEIFVPVSRLDPSDGATIACSAMFVIIQIAFNDAKQYQFALNSLVDISPIIQRRFHFENRILPYVSLHQLSAAPKLEESLVDIYPEIMVYLVTMISYRQKSSSSKIFCPNLISYNLIPRRTVSSSYHSRN